MHDEPRPGADPGDLTERHAITPDQAPESSEGQASPPAPASTGPTWPSATPTTPGGASVDPWAPSTGSTASSDPALDRFAPSPEPRSDWARSWDQTPPVTPERWYEPAATPVPASAVPVPPRKRTGGSSLLAAALLSAVLASGGTVLALSAAGALDRPAAPTSAAVAQGTNVGALQPVSIDEQSATIAVASKVSPAVVRITVTGTTNDGNNGVIPETGVGSGVIFDSNGWILTNHHVVEGGEKFDVELKDGRVLSGTVYGIDTLTDLAIVKVDATGLPSAAIGESDALKVGQLVVAIGSPLGTYSNSVTSGIVSAKGRSIQTDGNDSLTNLIQTDAAINPGNSGGPLLDAAGSIVGINTAIASNSNGIGFAIPIDIARPILEQALRGDELARPWIGIRFTSVDLQVQESNNLPVDHGAWVTTNGQGESIIANSPAASAGLQDGDIITAIEGT